MELGLMEGLDDGNCCTFVAVKAPARRVADALGKVSPILEDGKVHQVDGTLKAYVLGLTESEWCLNFHT